MTRVNLIDPSELYHKHLVSEYRELPRIFNQVRAAIVRGETPSDKRNPKVFCLGTGHVRFFYPRIKFLKDRQYKLIAEMLRRGYNPSRLKVEVDDIPWYWHGDYVPTIEAVALSRARIMERTPL